MCSLEKRSQNFIKSATEKYGDTLDYNKVNFVNSKTKVKIVCKVHGEFEQTPYEHLKRGCPKCNRDAYKSRKTMTTAEFIEKAKEVHGDKYDYSKVIYVRSSEKVEIICPEHGSFFQTPNNHMKAGCKACATEENAKNLSASKEIFVKKAKGVHNSIYDYSKVDYKNNKTEVTIICPIHGEFNQTPDNHLQGKGCPICRASKGETEIVRILQDKNISYEREKTFEGLQVVKSLRFDFYIPDLNLLIEYDGRQHFMPVNFGGITNKRAKLMHAKVKRNDKMKNEFAKTNGIQLLRISYKENISQKLSKHLL